MSAGHSRHPLQRRLEQLTKQDVLAREVRSGQDLGNGVLAASAQRDPRDVIAVESALCGPLPPHLVIGADRIEEHTVNVEEKPRHGEGTLVQQGPEVTPDKHLD